MALNSEFKNVCREFKNVCREFESQKCLLNVTRTQSSCEKSISQRSAEGRGFSPGTPVSSHRESWQGGLDNAGPQ